MSDTLVYPDQFPLASVQTLIQAIRGKGSVPIGNAIHAGLTVACFAAGQIAPPSNAPPWPPKGTIAPESMDPVALLEACCDCYSAGCSMVAGNPLEKFDWRSLLISLLPIILDFINKR